MADETVQAPQSIEVVVKNKHGMHLRCCGEVARIANGFKCHITMKNSRRETDAKSMLGLTTLAAACGSRILITAVGPDANDALSALNNYFSCDSE